MEESFLLLTIISNITTSIEEICIGKSPFANSNEYGETKCKFQTSNPQIANNDKYDKLN